MVENGRPVGLVTTDNDISGATLALIGLGVAGVGMFVAGMAALFAKLFNMDKLLGKDFERGLARLKAVAEGVA